MAEPTLKRTSVVLKYTASDGYRSEFEAKGGTGTQHLVTGEEVAPEKALLAGLEELSRQLCLFGFEYEARQTFERAALAVVEWREHLKPASGVKVCPDCGVHMEGTFFHFKDCPRGVKTPLEGRDG